MYEFFGRLVPFQFYHFGGLVEGKPHSPTLDTVTFDVMGACEISASAALWLRKLSWTTGKSLGLFLGPIYKHRKLGTWINKWILQLPPSSTQQKQCDHNWKQLLLHVIWLLRLSHDGMKSDFELTEWNWELLVYVQLPREPMYGCWFRCLL